MAESVVITGVAGFIGSQVARRFMAEGYKVFGVDDMSTGNAANVPLDIEFLHLDLTKQRAVERGLPDKVTYVLHFAGQSSGEISFDNPGEDLRKNVLSTLNLISKYRGGYCNKFLYASSMSVYGDCGVEPVREDRSLNPLSCYGIGKVTSESYLKLFKRDLPYVNMRMFNVYGPGQDLFNLRQGMVSIYLSQALNNSLIEVKGSLERFRDFIYIDDVVQAWFEVTTKEKVYNLDINVGSGVRTSVKSLLDQIIKVCPGTTYYTSSATPGDQTGIVSDNNRLMMSSGLDGFIAIPEGLDRTVAYEKNKLQNDRDLIR